MVHAWLLLLVLVAFGHARHAVALDPNHAAGEVCEVCATGAVSLTDSTAFTPPAIEPAGAPAAFATSLVSRPVPTARGRDPPYFL